MSALTYRPDWDEARRRLTTWWRGGDIGRPAMQITAPRPQPWETIEPVPTPEGWVTDYSTKSLAYRLDLALRRCAGTQYFAEAVPTASPSDLAPNCLALYLGCRGVEMPGTVWCQPCITSPESARFQYDPDNSYWTFSQRACREMAARAGGRVIQQFPDLIEGLDTLAAMRGTETLLMDLIERPQWVRTCLRQITDRYFHYYDVLYDLIRDEVGGSVFWAWGPGRTAKFQCDFSAMISPEMFREFMVPVLTEMTQRVSYSVYHWDGPGAIAHHDHLLSLPDLDVIQWTPGAGAEPTWHRRWWPLYHKTLDAGKKVFIFLDADRERLLALKNEFGEKAKNFLLTFGAESESQAREFIQIMER